MSILNMLSVFLVKTLEFDCDVDGQHKGNSQLEKLWKQIADGVKQTPETPQGAKQSVTLALWTLIVSSIVKLQFD